MTTATTPPSQPSIGIIGAGLIGRAIAGALALHGIAATLSNSRGAESLAETVAALGPTIAAGSREEAAARDIVFVAVNWSKLPAALSGLPDFGGRIVVDANNPIEAPRFIPADLHGRASSEIVADMVPGARLVKAFNHLPPALLTADPRRENGRRVLFLSGDDAQAKAEIAALIERLGFFGIDLGPLAVGARLAQFPGGPLPALDLVRFDGPNPSPQARENAMASRPVDIATTFFAHWSANRIDDALAMLSEDVLYDNAPFPDIIGRENVRKFHADFGLGTSFRVDWKITAIAAAGDVALHERIDVFTHASGGRITLPVMGAITVKDGMITVWRDYFDAGAFDRQLAGIRR